SATSELSRLNAPAPGTTTVSPDMAARLARSLTLSAESDGAFDVRLGPLTAIWRRPSPPSEPEVDGARAGSRPNAVRGRAGRVRLEAGARLDFDGIAKGWAVDACAARLRDAGVTSGLVSLGESSLFALGAPAGASRWRLAGRGPDPDTTVGWVGLRDAGASVSATYGSDGKRAGHVAHVLDPSSGWPLPDDAVAGAVSPLYRRDGKWGVHLAHVLDPSSGRPLTDDAVAVVVAPSATDAEAWTKALLVWGGDGGPRARRAGAPGASPVGRGAVRRDGAG